MSQQKKLINAKKKLKTKKFLLKRIDETAKINY